MSDLEPVNRAARNVTLGYIVAMRAPPQRALDSPEEQKRICFIYLKGKVHSLEVLVDWTNCLLFSV